MVKIRIQIFLLISTFIIVSCAQPQGTLPSYNQELSVEEQKIQNQLFADSWLKAYLNVSEVGLNILFNAVELCREDDQIFGIGADIATRYDGPEQIRSELTKSLFLTDDITIVATGINTPARNAGLKRGDKIIKINDQTAPYGVKATSEFYKKIRESKNKTHQILVKRNDQEILINVKAQKQCRFGFFVDLDNNTFNAFADGNFIALSLRMAKWLAQDEIGIPLVFAHELAHNAYHHIDDKKTNMQAGAGIGLLLDILARSQGVQTDFMRMGANMGASGFFGFAAGAGAGAGAASAGGAGAASAGGADSGSAGGATFAFFLRGLKKSFIFAPMCSAHNPEPQMAFESPGL